MPAHGSESTAVDVIVLGSGTSHGVPMIGCDCAVCTSDDPRDHRTRPSIFVRHAGVHLLVDTSPELRIQCLACNVRRVDAVLFTHHHADHVVGIDDLRRFNWIMKRALRCYGSEATLAVLQRMFGYAFSPRTGDTTSRPVLDPIPIGERPFEVDQARIIPIPLRHGDMPVLGFRFGSFAYCTDCSYIPDASYALLEHLDVLMLDALRRTPHPTHFHLERAVETAARIAARRTYFTHIAHELGHRATNAELPDGMALAHDGLTFRCPS
jgi:phosphoribosyl 1,2-cyclic phosphate phosphodiesterase